jgi:hypothetical protein
MWEQALMKAFKFAPDEKVEFDPDALLRLDPQAEATRLKDLVTGGIMEVDAARAKIGLPPVEGGYGKVPAMQQQMVGLDLLTQLHAADIANKLNPPTPPAAPAPNDPPPQDQPPQEDPPKQDPNKSLDPDIMALIVRDAISKAMAD